MRPTRLTTGAITHTRRASQSSNAVTVVCDAADL